MAPANNDALVGGSVGSAGPQKIPRPSSLAASAAGAADDDVIDKASFFNSPPAAAAAAAPAGVKAAPKESDDLATSNWAPTQLRNVPAFYPLERSSRLVDDELNLVAARISEANRVLSVQAIYDNETATAALFTAEHVEMLLSLWKTPKHPDAIVVELQRRKGDSLAFHRYSRYILDAAVGDFDAKEHVAKHGGSLDPVYSKKIQRLLSANEAKQPATERESAIIALEIAHGLLMKDRMDARTLGLESLCLLTDPGKTGLDTALIASRVVLLGTALEDGEEPDHAEMMFDETPFREIREIILSLIQLRRIGDADDIFDDGMSHPDDEAHISILHNLALAVLANALDVIENEEKYDEEPEDIVTKPRSRTESSTSICESFLAEASDATDREILSTLIQELGKAEHKPHNACLSAKCIGSLCRASEEARKRAKELGAKNVVQTALDVGSRTHLKLATECEKAATALSAPIATRTETVLEEQQEDLQSDDDFQEDDEEERRD